MVTDIRHPPGNAHHDVEDAYRRVGARLWRAVWLYSGSREVAEDAVAEAFAQALRRGDAIESMDGWVWAAAFRIAAGMLERGRRADRAIHELSYEDPEVSDLIDAVLTLSPRQRASVILHYYADYPVKDVAAMQGTTPAAVGVHLHRARKHLRKILEEADG